MEHFSGGHCRIATIPESSKPSNQVITRGQVRQGVHGTGCLSISRTSDQSGLAVDNACGTRADGAVAPLPCALMASLLRLTHNLHQGTDSWCPLTLQRHLFTLS